jgi:hypothetical protein
MAGAVTLGSLLFLRLPGDGRFIKVG